MQSPSKYQHNSSQTLKEQYSNTYGKTRNPLDVYLGQPRCSREGLGLSTGMGALSSLRIGGRWVGMCEEAVGGGEGVGI